MKALALLGLLWAVPCSATTTYYVGINQAGSSNTVCDGTTPTNTGSGHCPFKDLTSVTVRNLVQNVSDVRMEFRAGVYDVGATAFIIQGSGSSAATAVTIAAYAGEAVVFDGGSVSRETLRTSGSYVVVTGPGITIQNAHDYNLELRGGDHVTINRIRFGRHVASDSLKADGGASDVVIQYNTFTDWVSQAIDLAGVARVQVLYNDFSRPTDTAQPCVGAKFEADDVTVGYNTLRDCAGIAAGGVSSSHAGTYEALRMIVEFNHAERLTAALVEVYSCVDCIIRNNSQTSGVLGIRLSGPVKAQTVGGCNTGVGCVATSGLSISNNTFRGLVASPNNAFWIAEGTEISGLTSTTNAYCTVSGDATARYAVDSVVKTFAQWQSAVSTDGTSTVYAFGDSHCDEARGVSVFRRRSPGEDE